MNEENKKSQYQEPIATFTSNQYLLAFNILYRTILFALICSIVYMLLAIPFKFKLDPITFFIKYLSYCLGFSLLIAMVWTFYFHRKTIEACKDKMIIYKGTERRRTLEKKIDYSSIISFDIEKNYFILIPLPADKIILSSGSGKINKLTKLSTLSNDDFERLLEICNYSRKDDLQIPLRRSRTFHT